MPKKPSIPKAEAKTVEVPIKWNVPEYVITRVATNMVCQLVEGYIKVMFFETKPPISLIPAQTLPTEIEADCVASVILPPDKIPAIIKVLEGQLQKHQAKKGTKDVPNVS